MLSCNSAYRLRYWNSAKQAKSKLLVTTRCNSAYRLRYWNNIKPSVSKSEPPVRLQQCLSFTVCAKGCETAEEQSDDEVRTSQVPERREGKTKVIKQQYLPFTVLKLYFLLTSFSIARLQQSLPFTVLKRITQCTEILTIFIYCNAPTVYGMCRRVRGCRAMMRSVLLLPERREGKTKMIR